MKGRLLNQAVILAAVALSYGAISEVRAGRIDFNDVKGVPSTCGTASSRGTGDISKTFLGICNLDIVFTVRNSGELRTEDFMESVVNSMGPPWTDFHMRLGFGTGDLFVPMPAGCVSFKNPTNATSTPFKLDGTSPTGIDWGGGPTLDSNGSFTFALNVPDRTSNMCTSLPSSPDNRPGYQFTLRETPTTVPEPVTILLFSTGLAGVIIKTRKRLKVARE
jgi:hypothetical protein